MAATSNNSSTNPLPSISARPLSSPARSPPPRRRAISPHLARAVSTADLPSREHTSKLKARPPDTRDRDRGTAAIPNSNLRTDTARRLCSISRSSQTGTRTPTRRLSSNKAAPDQVRPLIRGRRTRRRRRRSSGISPSRPRPRRRLPTAASFVICELGRVWHECVGCFKRREEGRVRSAGRGLRSVSACLAALIVESQDRSV